MSRYISGRGRKWLFGLVLGATVVLLVFSALPLLVEHFLLPGLLDRAGQSPYRIAVSRFGLGGASFHISAKSADALITGGTLRVQWTVPGLLQRRLDRVVLDGLLVNLSLGEKSEKDAQGVSSQPRVSSEPPGIPVIVEEIQVVNSVIVLRDNGRVTSLPVSLFAQLQNTEKVADRGILRYRTRIDVAEYGILTDCTYDLGLGKLFGQLEAEIPLASLSENIPHFSLPLMDLDGRADLTGVYDFRLVPFSIERVEAQVLFKNLRLSGTGMTVQSVDDKTAAMTVSGGKGSYLVQGTGFSVTEPLMTTLAIDTHITVADSAISWQGDFLMQLPAGPQFSDRLVLDEAVLIKLHHEGDIANGRTVARVTGGIGLEKKKSSSFVFHDGDNVVKMDSLAVDGRLAYQPQSRASSLEFDFSLIGKDLERYSRGMRLILPELSFLGAGSIPLSLESKDLGVTGSLTLSDGSLEMQNQGVHLQGMHLSLPYVWSGQQQAVAGDFRIDTVSSQQGRLGTFSGSVRQVGLAMFLQGDLQTVLMPDNAIALDGVLRFGREQGVLAELSFGVENGRLDVQSFASLYPALSSVTGSANLDIKGSVTFDACGMDGELSAQLYKGNFAISEADFELQNVQLGLHVSSLQRLETDPSQKLRIGTIRSKKFIVHDVQTLFRVESPESLFIERISGKWSGGRIFTSGFRLQKGKQELELALFCDRLELASILSQFGLAEAYGTGKMSGRIPLKYKDGEIFVDDGFLFTSPGKKGNLKIRESRYLSVGMPADAVQFSPLHFAGAALSDFEYDWAKLNVLSEGGDLLLKLQIDGKPRGKLPYRFDAASNVFIRLEEGASGGLDQPVKLDVNFRVPVNDLFRYQSQLMPLLHNFK